MREFPITAIVITALLSGCAQNPAAPNAGEARYYTVSFPKIALKPEPLERIESVEVVMHCGRFAAINHIPDDWSAEVLGPSSEETKLHMEAGHGTSMLFQSAALNEFITVLDCESSCFDISGSVSVFSYDTEEHERKILFKQADLIMKETSHNAK